jgi:hypothetical protein
MILLELIRQDLEEVVPPGSWGIVALFAERWVDEVDSELVKADKVTKHQVDSESAKEVKATAASET